MSLKKDGKVTITVEVDFDMEDFKNHNVQCQTLVAHRSIFYLSNYSCSGLYMYVVVRVCMCWCVDISML